MPEYRYLLDSNICIYLIENLSPILNAKVAQQQEGSLCISAISLAEVAVGYGQDIFDAPDIAAFLEEIPAVEFGTDAAKIYGTLPFKRAKFDHLIAAHALALGLTLVSNNESDFADVRGLVVENWTA